MIGTQTSEERRGVSLERVLSNTGSNTPSTEQIPNLGIKPDFGLEPQQIEERLAEYESLHSGGLVVAANEPYNLTPLRNRSRIHTPNKGILLAPRKAEIAVLNPAIYQDNETGPCPFLYRSTLVNKWGEEYSVIKFKWLLKSTELSKQGWTLIYPEHDYECMGCEDPRITKINGFYLITYVAYDGINARAALAVTRDFKTIKKLGPVGPQIPLKEAIDIVGDRRYQDVWARSLESSREKARKLGYRGEILLDNKDAALDVNGKLAFYFRLDPDEHVVVVKYFNDLVNQEFWRRQIENLGDRVWLRGREAWCEKKVGIGNSPRNSQVRTRHGVIGVYHGVADDHGSMRYSGSAYLADPDHPRKLLARLREPIFSPDSEDCIFRRKDDDGEVEKKAVKFPTAALLEKGEEGAEDMLVVYEGVGDERIAYEKVNLRKLMEKLRREFNRHRFN